MNNKKSKQYYEKRAQLTLIDKFSTILYSDKIELQDCPDLYDKINDVGIEVTRAFYENHAEISSISSEYIKNPFQQFDSKKEEYIKKLGGKILQFDNMFLGIVYKANWVGSNELEKCYNAKIEKLNKGHYQKCKSYDLYIFSPGFEEYDDNHMEQFMQKVMNTNVHYSKQFRNIIVDDLYYIYLCDFNAKKLIKYDMPRDIVHNICVESKKYSESVISD